MIGTEPTRIDFLSSDVEIEFASGFTKFCGRITKQPRVSLQVKETSLKIFDKNVMWQFLDSLAEEKFYFNTYLRAIDEFPLKVIINDFLSENQNHLFCAWVEDGVILGFDEKEHKHTATSQSLKEIGDYINGKGEEYKSTMTLRTYYQPMTKGGNAKRGLTAHYISGNKIIEIFCKPDLNNPLVIMSARYSIGWDFVQPIQARTFKGMLSTIKVKEIYDTIDLFLLELEILDRQDLPRLDSVSKSHRLTIQDRNRLEFENYFHNSN